MLLQGVMTYTSIVDAATGLFFIQQQAQGYEQIKNLHLRQGMTEARWDEDWRYLEEYLQLFPHPVIQNTVFSIKSHWDWYIDRLGKFLEFAKKHEPDPILNNRQQKKLERIGRSAISEQITIVESATGVSLGLEQSNLESVEEMARVRNLSMHNLWEVDQDYLANSRQKHWQVGEVRQVTISEMEQWHKSLTEIIVPVSTQLSERYNRVPDYP